MINNKSLHLSEIAKMEMNKKSARYVSRMYYSGTESKGKYKNNRV